MKFRTRIEELEEQIKDAEFEIDQAQSRINGLQLEIGRERCKAGVHSPVMFTNPPLGMACMFCRTLQPAP